MIYARRLVAQRCLYGVDRNAAAVDLAKLSLWLATLAKDHPLTFLNHALRHGRLAGGALTRADRGVPLEGWVATDGHGGGMIREHLRKVRELREHIRSAGEDTPDWELRRTWGRREV